MTGRRAVCLIALVLGLTACTAPDIVSPPARPDPAPAAAPTRAPTPPARPTPAPPGPSSDEVTARYAALERNLLVRGLLRRDGGGPDTPYDAEDLTRNFLRIALFDEYVTRDGSLESRPTESRLRRWDRPIRLSVEFGPSVSRDDQITIRNSVMAYAGRLSRLTGLSITPATGSAANYHVLVLSEDERRNSAARLRALAPEIQPAVERSLVTMPPATLCAVVAFGSGDSYGKAIAVIRAEHPDLLRLSCIHEELAQGLGLVNDSPRARPSIFNDDEEFALLTSHDETLLRILYDPRLRSGMSLAEATPIVRQIAREQMGGES